jgi:hypothetical protein
MQENHSFGNYFARWRMRETACTTALSATAANDHDGGCRKDDHPCMAFYNQNEIPFYKFLSTMI